MDDQLVIAQLGRAGQAQAVLDQRVGRAPQRQAVQVVLGVPVHAVEHELGRAGQVLGPEGHHAAVPPLDVFPVPHGQDVLAEEKVLGQQPGPAQVKLDVAGDAGVDAELVAVLARAAVSETPHTVENTMFQLRHTPSLPRLQVNN